MASYSYKPPRNPIPYLFLTKRHQYVRSILKNSLILDIGSNRWKIISNAISLDLDKFVHPDIVGNCLSLPFLNSIFDSVTALELIEHFNSASQDILLEEVKRVLKPHGQFIISTPNISNSTRKIHDLLWYVSHFVYAREDLGQHIGELTHYQLTNKLGEHGFTVLKHKSFTLFNYVVEAEK